MARIQTVCIEGGTFFTAIKIISEADIELSVTAALGTNVRSWDAMLVSDASINVGTQLRIYSLMLEHSHLYIH